MPAENEKELWDDIRQLTEQASHGMERVSLSERPMLCALLAIVKTLDSIDSRLIDIESNTRGTEAAVEALESRR